MIYCVIDGCVKPRRRSKKGVCEMHYTRFYRTGSYDIKERNRQPRLTNSSGYQKLHKPGHVLANADEYVYEHRYVMYESVGDDVSECSICGKPISWRTCHIDHIDNDVANNNISNLRATCPGCNTSRGRNKAEHEYSRATAISAGGKTMTPAEWARMPGVTVTGPTIKRRFKSGQSAEEAIYTPSKTLKGARAQGQ